jgi:hypothetical protein
MTARIKKKKESRLSACGVAAVHEYLRINDAVWIRM